MWKTQEYRSFKAGIFFFIGINSVTAGVALVPDYPDNGFYCTVPRSDFQWVCRVDEYTRGVCAVTCSANSSCHFYVRNFTSGRCQMRPCPKEQIMSFPRDNKCSCPHKHGYKLRTEGHSARCVFMLEQKMNYFQGKAACRKLKGRLIKADTVELITLVNQLAIDKGFSSRTHVWIGLDDREGENHFKWVDGTSMTNEQKKLLFRKGQPDNDHGKGEDCGSTYGLISNDLDDYFCEKPAAVACEYDMSW